VCKKGKKDRQIKKAEEIIKKNGEGEFREKII